MANVSFLPAALAEYQDAYAWYFARSVRAAVAFQSAVDDAIRQIAATPDQWPFVDDVHRTFILRRYPYSIVYRVVNGDVVIVAVAHARRRTGRIGRNRRTKCHPEGFPTVPQRLLLLETSGRIGQVALAEGDSLLSTRRLDETRHQARDLAPAVAELLAGADWKPRDVTAVVVSRGPGSYTGLRVGVMSAKAFAYAAGCALLAIDTFPIIASQAPADANPLDVIADAQQQKVYLQRFERGASVSPLVIRPVAEWLADAPAAWVSGPGLRLHRPRLPATVLAVDELLWEPRPESLLALALKRWHAGERDDPFAVEPLYLRPSSAETQWQTLKPSGCNPRA